MASEVIKIPFKSKVQQRMMFARHPKIAKKWAEHTPDIKGLPEKAEVFMNLKKGPEPDRKGLEYGNKESNNYLHDPTQVLVERAKKNFPDAEVAGEDDTLMGRLAKRMASRDYIDRLNLGMGKGVAKAERADDEVLPRKMSMGSCSDDWGRHQQTMDIKSSNMNDPILYNTGKIAEGNNMAEQAKSAGNVIGIKQEGTPLHVNRKCYSEDLKHGDVPDSEFDQEQLQKGIKVEMEHTNDINIAKQIVKAHLKENSKYYEHLEKME